MLSLKDGQQERLGSSPRGGESTVSAEAAASQPEQWVYVPACFHVDWSLGGEELPLRVLLGP